ncbi:MULTISPECIES: tyrosine-type recombinase/integrase [Cysteiniphilum]|uniref:Recombinase n=1 Tax=Cysteiniphilum litorale TaxID=2056700 RepID=A0A8J2Z646_9GAMM|nr:MULTISPECIES: tyrosine-type recombinase/integrase [Cysteiniphilum]GGG04031.1 recombinase [Cysteiniphilum litorale]
MKNKITNSIVKSWIKSAKQDEQLWDTQLHGFILRKNKQGASYKISYRDSSNKRRTYTIGNYPTITPQQARDIAQLKLADIAKGVDIQQEKKIKKNETTITGMEYLETIYKPIHLANTNKNKTANYNILKNRFGNSILKIDMLQVSQQHIIAWQSQQKKIGIKHSTLVRDYGTLKAMFKHAYQHGYIYNNPIANVNLIKEHETTEEIRQRREKRTYLTIEQMNNFLKAIDSYQDQKRIARTNSRKHGKKYLPCLDNVLLVDHVKPMLITMFYTGFRNGDVISLRWEDINFTFNNITKVLEKTSNHKPHPITFIMPPQLSKTLKQWHQQHKYPSNGLVFPSDTTGKQRDKNTINAAFKKIKKLANLPEQLQPYTLRHNFISWLVMKGIDLLTITKLTGHSDVKMIIEHYGHLQPKMIDNAVNTFANITNTLADNKADQYIV